MARRTFLSTLRWLVPSWLYDEVTKSHAMILDEHVDRARAGLEARFPSLAQPDANALTGEDRGIPRGRAETDEHYAQRLIGWRYPRGHRVRGSAFALLNQVSEYFGGIICWTVDWERNRHLRAADGTESFSYAFPWVWDNDNAHKARFWVGIEPPSTLMAPPPDLGDPALWGGALGTPGYSIGQTGATPDDKDAIVNLFRGDVQWKPAGTRPQWLIVKISANTYTPDATWANWSKVVGGVRLPSRGPGWRYWALFDGVNDYAPTAANATASLPLPDGTSLAFADPDSALASIHLPDGSTYVPNANNAKATIDLVDDGDQP